MAVKKQEYVVPVTFTATVEVNIKAVSEQDALFFLKEMFEEREEEAVNVVCQSVDRDQFEASCDYRPFKATNQIQQFESTIDSWRCHGYWRDLRKDGIFRYMLDAIKRDIKFAAGDDKTADLSDLNEALRFSDVMISVLNPAVNITDQPKKCFKMKAKKKETPERVRLYAVPVTHKGIALVHVKAADEKEAVDAAILKATRKNTKLPDHHPVFASDPSEVIDLTAASKLRPCDKNWRMVWKSDLEDALMTERALNNLMNTVFKCRKCGGELIAKVIEEFDDSFDTLDDAYDGHFICADCRDEFSRMDLEDQMDELLAEA